MIGTFNKSDKYHTVADFDSLAAFFDYMFSGVNGFIYSCGKSSYNGHNSFYNNAINLNKLSSRNGKFDLLSSSPFKDIINTESKSFDRYMTLNQFTYIKGDSGKPNLSRKIANAKRLNAFFVDIDCYALGLSQASVIYELTYDLSYYHLPQWTFLISSGRGIYVIWKLRDEDGFIDAQRKKWSTIEKTFCKRLAKLGADPKATDISRVLRVPFSYNSKNGAQVKILDFCDTSYSLYDIASEYVPEALSSRKKEASAPHVVTAKMIYCADKLASALGVESPAGKDFFTIYSFLQTHKSMIKHTYKSSAEVPAYLARQAAENASDIAKLMSLRHGCEAGYREEALFLYRACLMLASSDSEYALRKTLELNSSFSFPLSTEEVCKATESAKRYYLRYKFTRAYIAHQLSVSADESNALAHLPADGQKHKPRFIDRATRKINNHSYYVKKLNANGQTSKASKIKNRHIILKTLISKGLPLDIICKRLSISKATLYRDLKALNLSSSASSHSINNKNVLKLRCFIFSFFKSATFNIKVNLFCYNYIRLYTVQLYSLAGPSPP